MTAKREHRALRSALVVSGFGYLAQGLSLVAIPLFLGTLGAGSYGLMVTVMAFMGYLCFADAGLSWGSMILIAQAHGRKGQAEIAHIVRHSVVLALGSGAVVAVALGAILLASAAGWRLPMFAGHPEADRLLLIAGVQLGLTLQCSVFYNLFHGLQEGYWAGFYQGLGRLLGSAGAMGAAWLTHRVEAVMMVQLAATVASGAAAALHVWRRHPWAFATGSWVDRVQYEAQLRIGAKNFLLQIGRTLSSTAPTLGISSILGTAMVPFYSVPTTLLTMFFTPINSWNASMQNAYGEAWVAGERDWVRNAFRQSLERATILGALGIALFFALGDRFIRLWTHDRLWVDPATAVSVASVVAIGALLSAGQFLLTGLNCHRRAALAEVANGLLAIVLVVLAARGWGLPGVGVAVVVAAAATSAWVLWRQVRAQLEGGCFPRLGFWLRAGLALTAASVAAALARRGLTNGGELSAALGLALAGGIGCVVFLTAAVALKLIAMADAVTVGRWMKTRRAVPAS